MKQTKAIKFQLTDRDMHTLVDARDLLAWIDVIMPSGYNIRLNNGITLKMDDINNALDVISRLGRDFVFHGYNTSEEEN